MSNNFDLNLKTKKVDASAVKAKCSYTHAPSLQCVASVGCPSRNTTCSNS